MKPVNKLLCLLLAAVLLFSTLPQAAAEEEDEEAIPVFLCGDSIACTAPGAAVQGSTLTITEGGTYALTGTLENGQIRINASKNDKVKLVLKGASLTCSGAPAIYCLSAGKTVITTEGGTQNVLATEGSFAEGDSADAALFSKDDLTLNGSGTLYIVAEKGHGIVCKDELKITAGEVTVSAGEKGICGKDGITIKGGGITVKAADDAVSSEGDITVSGGTLTVTTGDDGIHASGNLFVEGGSITVEESYEGLEGHTVTIRGGIVCINASDDGINAAGGSDASTEGGGFGHDRFMADTDEEAGITISGGSVTVNAGGDGLDSNGYLLVSGGKTLISGPETGANGALDYGTFACISGGTLIAAGAAGMAEGFGEDSTQASILYAFSKTYAAGTALSLKDEAGNTIAAYSPVSSFSSVVISAPALKSTGTYHLFAGSDEFTIETDGVSWTNRKGGMPGGPGSRGGFGRFKEFGAPDGEDSLERPDGFGRDSAPWGAPGGVQPPQMPEGEPPEMPEGAKPPDWPERP